VRFESPPLRNLTRVDFLHLMESIKQQRLTIDSYPLSKGDRVTIITDVNWSDYEKLNLKNERVSFRNGIITIVSPGRNHEIIGDLIRAIIWAYCRQNKLPIFTFNQTRLKKEGFEGKEPDVAYCFGVDKENPDLAVEINLTSGSIDDLTKYQYLKISEVWLWEQNKIKIFAYRPFGYLELTSSNCLSNLTCDRVTDIVNTYFGKNLLEIDLIEF
jgi:Uma2 family endonuclease